MKNLTIALLFLLCVSLSAQDYDKQKDKYVNAILDGPVMKFDRDTSRIFSKMRYDIYFDGVLLEANHSFYVPYKQEEEWSFHMTKESGEYVSLFRLFSGGISVSTERRIINLCYRLDKINGYR